MKTDFFAFLDQLEAQTHSPLIESVRQIYILCEADQTPAGEPTTSETTSDSDALPENPLPENTAEQITNLKTAAEQVQQLANEIDVSTEPTQDDINASNWTLNEAIEESISDWGNGVFNGAKKIGSALAKKLANAAAIGATAIAATGCAGGNNMLKNITLQSSPDEQREMVEERYGIQTSNPNTEEDIQKLAAQCKNNIKTDAESGTPIEDTQSWNDALVIYDMLLNNKIATADPSYSNKQLANNTFAAPINKEYHVSLGMAPDLITTYQKEKTKQAD